MKRDFTERLCCATCRVDLILEADAGDAVSIIGGSLICPRCGVIVPIAQGFPFFTRADIAAQPVEALLGTKEDYRAYHQRKFERGELEIYAAFHPFNESLRASEPLLAAIGAKLRPGDIILEPWARTGWTAGWLAALFPEQVIVALWEGDSSVLGYQGFAQWFSAARRPSNLELLFVHPDRGLPFPDGSIGAVFSHDCFHRFGMETFAADLLRVARADAPILLAHTHLSNSEPDPWFDRGGVIRHGRDYRRWLDRLCHGTSREGWIWSEGDLFGADRLPPDLPDMAHYNALILIAEPASLAMPPAEHRASADRRLLLNPLYWLHSGRSAARIDRGHLDGMVGHMLERHPLYVPRLGAASINLGDEDWLLMLLAVCAIPIADLADELRLPAANIVERIERLKSVDLVLAVEAGRSAVDLQRFHANQLPPNVDFLDLTALCARATLRGPGGFEVSGEELLRSVELVAAALRGMGAGPDGRVTLGGGGHPLLVITLLAALAVGSDVELGGVVDSVSVAGEFGVKTVPFGWASEPDGLIALLDQAERLPLATLAPDQRIYLHPGLQVPSIRVARLLEGALSLRHSMAPVFSIDRLVSIADYLAALVEMSRGPSANIQSSGI